LIDGYLEEKEYVETRKPDWLFVDAHDRLEYGLFNYFPEAHYKAAIDNAFEQNAEETVRDGRQSTRSPDE
jgi:hypothetical protein